MVTPCFEYYSRLMRLKLFGFPGVKGRGREGELARKLKLHHLVELDRITVMRMHIGRNSKWRRKCRRTTNIAEKVTPEYHRETKYHRIPRLGVVFS